MTNHLYRRALDKKLKFRGEKMLYSSEQCKNALVPLIVQNTDGKTFYTFGYLDEGSERIELDGVSYQIASKAIDGIYHIKLSSDII